MEVLLDLLLLVGCYLTSRGLWGCYMSLVTCGGVTCPLVFDGVLLDVLLLVGNVAWSLLAGGV